MQKRKVFGRESALRNYLHAALFRCGLGKRLGIDLVCRAVTKIYVSENCGGNQNNRFLPSRGMDIRPANKPGKSDSTYDVGEDPLIQANGDLLDRLSGCQSDDNSD